jgi:putative phosphoribosyl transferase
MFWDRESAGRMLARRLSHPREHSPVVVGLARGGIPVAAEIARALAAPLDAWVVKKLRAPFGPDATLGPVTDADVARLLADAQQVGHAPPAAVR